MPQNSIIAWLTQPVASQQLPNNPPNSVLGNYVEEHRPKDSVEQPLANNADNSPEACAVLIAPLATVTQSVLFSESQPRLLRRNVTLELCDKNRLLSFQRLTSLLLPIPYSKSFYAETISDSTIASLTRIAIWHDASNAVANEGTAEPMLTPSSGRLVGAIRCRLLHGTPPALYISTIGVLAPYRELGLATHLLTAVTKVAVQEHGIKEVVAHVWEANQEGLAWYKKRGFQVVSREENYYKRLKPHTAAFVVTWKIGVTDLLGWEGP